MLGSGLIREVSPPIENPDNGYFYNWVRILRPDGNGGYIVVDEYANQGQQPFDGAHLPVPWTDNIDAWKRGQLAQTGAGVFGPGYGHETAVSQLNDVLHDHDNVVRFGAGITPDMLTWSLSGNDLDVSIAGTSDILTLQNDLAGLPTAIQQFTFADGTTWTRAQVEQMIINQEIAGGDATIVGFVDGTNTFTAGASDETFEGRGGINTYVYASAGGNDVVDEGGRHDRHRLGGRAKRTPPPLAWLACADRLWSGFPQPGSAVAH